MVRSTSQSRLRRYCAAAISFTAIVAVTSVVHGGSARALPIPPPPEPVTTAAPLGRYPVGVNISSYTYNGRDLRLITWYPAQASSQPPFVTPNGITGTAVENAPLDHSGGPYPLIMFSPGLGAPGDGYYFYTQNLASQGYVVVGIDHDDATDAVPGLQGPELAAGLQALVGQNSSDSVFSLYGEWFRRTQFAMTYRPQEIRTALDTTLRRNDDHADLLGGSMNPDAIGMSGHSLGAAYTLLTGGMSIPCDHPIPAIDAHTPVTAIDPCALPARQAWPSADAIRDPRIKAIVPLASPVFVSDAYIPQAAADLSIPLMFITGADPYLEASRAPQWQVYAAAHGPKYFVEISDTDHFLVSDAAALNPYFSAVQLPWDKADFTAKAQAYMRYSTAFFDRYLKNDTSTGGQLDAPAAGVIAAVHSQS
ncbi:alpha/beta hydrolase family protein [Nocardia sp. NPDC056000]|uniref:alpha/beta hydrolase family protein n=1 Tax=Nocardia sp. NPDC056000 TaxID=3345674 RepID=UPI0035DC04DC